MARKIKTTFALDGEAKYRDAIKGINKEQTLLNAELKAATAQYDASGDKQKSLATKAESLTKQIELQKKKVAEAQNAVDQASKRYDNATAALEKMRQEGKEGTDEFKRQQEEVQRAEKALTDYKIDVANAEAGLGKMQTELAKANKEILLNESRLKKAGDAAEKAGAKMKTVGEKADKVGTGLTKGVTAPILAAGAGLLKLGIKFDDAVDKIRVGTGATGDTLAGLEADFEAVIQKVPADMDVAAGAIADLNTRLGLSGKPLQDLAQQYLELSKITGEDVTSSIEESTRAFQAWKIPAEKYGDGLNTIFKVSQATGIKTTELTQKVTDFAPALQDLGFTFEESAALIGKFEQTGVNTDTVLAALKKSTASFAKEGKSASEGLAEMTAKIKGAKTEGEAAKIAMEVFGAKAGPELAHQIRAGKLDIESFTKSIADNQETIGKAAADTYDWKEEWKMLTNQLAVELKPVAQQIFGAVKNATPTIKKIAEFVGDLAEKFGKLNPKQQESILKMVGITAAAGPLIKAFGKVTSGVGNVTETVGKYITKLAEKKAAETAAGAASEAAAAGVTGVGTAATGASTKLGGLGGILGNLANPTTGLFVLMIGAAVALGTALDNASLSGKEAGVLFKKSFEEYGEAVANTNGVMEMFVADTTASGQATSDVASKIDETEAKIVAKYKEYMNAKGKARDNDLADLRKYYKELADLMSEELTAYQKALQILADKIQTDIVPVTKDNVKEVTKSIQDGLEQANKKAEENTDEYIKNLDRKAMGDEAYFAEIQRYRDTNLAADKAANAAAAADAAEQARKKLEASEGSLKTELDNINKFGTDRTSLESEYAAKVEEIKNGQYATELQRTQALQQLAGEYATKFRANAQDIGKAWESVDGDLQDAWLTLVETQAAGGKALDADTKNTVDALVQHFVGLGTQFGDIGDEAMAALGRAILNEESPEKAAAAKDKECIEAFKQRYGEYQETGSLNAGAYSEGISDGQPKADKAGRDVAERANRSLRKGKEGANKAGKDAGFWFSDGLSSKEKDAEDAANDIKNATISPFNTLGGILGAFGSGGISSFATSALSRKDSAGVAGSAARASFTSPFNTLGGTMGVVGANATQSFIDAIFAREQKYKNAGAQAGKWFVWGAKSKSGFWFQSPSHKMTELADQVVDSFTGQVEDNKPEIEKSGAEIANATMKGADAEAAKIAEAQQFLKQQLADPKLSAQLDYAARGGIRSEVAARVIDQRVNNTNTSKTDNSTHVTIQTPNISVRSDTDIKRIAQQLAVEVDRKKRSKGA